MKNNSRLKNATYSIALTGLYEIVVFISSLILPRLILSTYGSEYNGIVSSIIQFLSIVSVLRLGIAGATRVQLYKSLGNNDIKRTSEIIKSTNIYMRKISFIIFIYIFALSLLYPLFVVNSYSFLEVSSLVLIIGIGTFAEYLFGFTYFTLLQSDQKLYIYYFVQTIATIVNITVSCILIKNNYSIQIVKLISTLIFASCPIILYIYVSKKYNIDKNVKPDNTAIKSRGDAAAHSIANIVSDNTDIILLTMFSDIKIVSIYTVYALVTKGIKQILTIFITGLESGFGNMWVKKETEKIKYNFSVYEFFIYFFSSVIFSCAIVLILPFVKIYTKGVTDINYIVPTFAIVIIIAQLFYSVRMPYQTVIQAAGKYKETKKIAWAEAILNIIISTTLVFKFGLVGVALGTLFANAIRTICYSNFVSTNLIIRPKTKLIRQIFHIGINIILTVGTFKFLIFIFKFNINNWNEWILCGFISFLISTIIALLNSLIFYKIEFKNCLDVIKRIINKNKFKNSY